MVVFCYNAFNKYRTGNSTGTGNMGYTSTPAARPSAKNNLPTAFDGDSLPRRYTSVGIFINPADRMLTRANNPTPSRLKNFSATMSYDDIREFCRIRNRLCYGGIADASWLETADRIRLDYIERVGGLEAYLHIIVPTSIIKLPANHCTVAQLDSAPVTGPPRQSIKEFLLGFPIENFPYELFVRRNITGRVETLRYSI